MKLVKKERKSLWQFQYIRLSECFGQAYSYQYSNIHCKCKQPLKLHNIIKTSWLCIHFFDFLTFVPFLQIIHIPVAFILDFLFWTFYCWFCVQTFEARLIPINHKVYPIFFSLNICISDPIVKTKFIHHVSFMIRLHSSKT